MSDNRTPSSSDLVGSLQDLLGAEASAVRRYVAIEGGVNKPTDRKSGISMEQSTEGFPDVDTELSALQLVDEPIPDTGGAFATTNTAQSVEMVDGGMFKTVEVLPNELFGIDKKWQMRLPPLTLRVGKEEIEVPTWPDLLRLRSQ